MMPPPIRDEVLDEIRDINKARTVKRDQAQIVLVWTEVSLFEITSTSPSLLYLFFGVLGVVIAYMYSTMYMYVHVQTNG